MNIKKTRIILYETQFPVVSNFIQSINRNWFELTAVIDGDISEIQNCPSVSFEEISDFSFWDLLLINDTMVHDKIMKILSVLSIPEERYVFLSNISDKIFQQALFLPDTRNGRALDFLSRKRDQNYFAVSTADNEFITNSTDQHIPFEMFSKKKTFSQDEIDLFIRLTQQYYDKSSLDSEGEYFFDIGANIGTTCIYVKKKLLPDVKIIAFEPVHENYKLLHANMILNEIEDYQIYEKAVMNRCASYTMQIDEANRGASSIIQKSSDELGQDVLTETVSAVTIENFLEEQNINSSQVRYVWIDTEGFETEVLMASTSLLREPETAFYLEYSPGFVDKERLDKLSEICSVYFKSFICIDDYMQGDLEPHPIEELYHLYKRYPYQTNIFLIK